MAWIYDTYDVMHPGRNNRPVVTGKPLELGGSLGRDQATGRGCLYVTQRFLAKRALPRLRSLEHARLSIQGFGEVGSAAARLFESAGATVIAVSDSQGGIYNDSGVDIDAALLHKAETGSVVGTPDTHTITNDELLALECDILIPAALGAQITGHNAEQVSAKLVVEAANSPVTPLADETLLRKGIPVLPDILTNAGGVTASYFEWVQNIRNENWALERVNEELGRKMRVAVDATLDRWRALAGDEAGQETSTAAPDWRTAALVVAIERLARVTLQRGIWP
jgi:glutamate dehydrogenase (NAD(P)+)